MKKILLALNPEHVNREAIDFTCYLGKVTRNCITGVFLETKPGITTKKQAETAPTEQHGAASGGTSTLRDAMAHFKDACVCREASYVLPKEQGITVEDLIEESHFSDLLVLNPALSIGTGVEAAPSSLVKHILSKTGCPIILTPEAFDHIEEIVFTYNGSKASVFAIKQFTYLFPEFRNSKVVILAVNAESDILADEPALMEWMNSHYRHITYTFSEGNPVDQLVAYLLPHNNAFVVMGAYGRNFFSRLIKRSTADPVSGTIFNPIFIAH